MRYLTSDEIARINESEVGPGQLADRSLLEAAAGRPQQSAGGDDAYPDVHHKAGALLHSLVKNHAFVDGNKRTGVIATAIFYGLNSHRLVASQDEIVEPALDVAEDRLDTVEGIAGRLERLTEQIATSGD